MLHNPSTPPYEDSTGTSTDTDNGLWTSAESSTMVDVAVITPVSNMSRHESERTVPKMEENEGFEISTVDDQDMSDGGAALTMSPSQIELSNMALDQFAADMGWSTPNNHTSLASESPSSSHYDDYQFADSVSPYNQESPEETADDSIEVDSASLTQETTSLPTALSAVSLQLQHLQDGLDHAEVAMTADEQDGSLENPTNSILPFPLHFTSPFASVGVPPIYVSMTQGAYPSNVPALGFQDDLETEVGGNTTVPDVTTTAHHQISVQIPQDLIPFVDILDNVTDADQDEVEDHYNLSLHEFLINWARSGQLSAGKRRRYPLVSSIETQRDTAPLQPVTRSDLQGEVCDIQRLNWAELGVTRQEAKAMRAQVYNNYQNVRQSPHEQRHPLRHGQMLVDTKNYFRFRRMDFDHIVKLTHFQLRNVMACASRGHVFYAGRSKVWQWNPSCIKNSTGPTCEAMNLSNPTVQPFHAIPGGMQISTLATAHDVLVVGGFCGEYALMNLRTHKDTKHTEGLITDELNAITNHVQVHLQRGSSLPVAAFSSNDMGFRVLDVNTNKFIAEHKYSWAINCSAISPDQRLRVCVGDTTDVMICNSDTGEVLQRLEGHRDFGFACDWADDGWTVATGNQDMMVKIWDARKWTSSSGASCPVTTIAAEMAGVRKLKFSPLGSGKRVLIAAEPADVISVIDAQTFQSKQTLSFFGEIGGVDFTNDGQDLFVANSDNMRGGIIQYERCGWAEEGRHRLESRRQCHNKRGRSKSYDWISDEDDLVAHPKARGTATHRHRKAACLGATIGYF